MLSGSRNTKLSKAPRLVWTWSLPSVSTCPGRSRLCTKYCYSSRLEKFREVIRERYLKNLFLSYRADFAASMISFIRANGVKLVRVHVAGDFRSERYALKWLEVMRACRRTTRFWFYTRSWRKPLILPVLVAMARLGNVRAWFSCDAETGLPPGKLPKRVRIAWLQTRTDEPMPTGTDLVFRTQHLRKKKQKRVGLTIICPAEQAPQKGTNCSQCGICWDSPP